MRNILLLIVAAMLYGCSQKNIEYTDLSETKEIKAKQSILIEDLKLGYPMQIEQIDSLIIIMDWMAADKHYFHIYNQKGEFIRKFGVKGRSKGELISPKQFFVDSETKSISVHQNGYYILYDMDKILKGKNDYAKKVKLDKFDYPVANYIPTSCGGVYLGFTDKMRFALINNNQEYIINSYPEEFEVDDNELKPQILSYGNKIYFSPNKKHFVQPTYIGAFIETFSVSEYGINKIAAKPIFKPVYKILEHGAVAWSEETTIGFDNVSTTNEYFYTLLNANKGLTLKTGKGDLFAKSIYVFDWNGVPHHKIVASNMMISLAVNSDNKRGYAVAFDQGKYSLIDITW